MTDRPSPTIGDVVRVRRAADSTALAVVAIVGENHPQLPPGRALGVLTAGEDVWLPASAVVDHAPRCTACGACAWWWTSAREVCCEICHPPAPEWDAAFAALHDSITRLPPEVVAMPAVQAALAGCDAAWARQQWGRFQAHALTVDALAFCLPHLVASRVQHS